MRRGNKAVAVVFSAAAAVAGTLYPGFANAADIPWILAPGTPGDYLNPANWTNNMLPQPGDAADVSNGGTIQISSGSINVGEIWAGSNEDQFNGTIIQTGGLVTATGPGYVDVGRFGATGTYNFSGGTINQSGGLVELTGNSNAVGGYLSTMMIIGGGTGTATLNHSGTLTVGDRAQGNVNFGNASLFVENNGTINSSAQIHVGDGGTGYLQQDGGTINAGTNELWIGNGGGTGTFVLNGGTVNTATWAVVGRAGGATGTLTINGGTFTHLGGNGDFEVGSYGGNNNATLNLNGGLLQTNFVRDETSGGSQIINFNGGTLQANNTDAGFIGGHGNLTALNVLGNGAVIDTNGHDIGITQGLLHSGSVADGGLTKLGTGALTLGGTSTYTGPTNISAGSFTVAGSITATSSFTLASGSNLNLSIGNLNSYLSPASVIKTGALNLNGNTVNVTVASATGGLSTGQVYNLISYTSETGAASTLNLVGQLPARASGTISDNHTSAISLTITNTDFIKWTGATSGAWDTTTPNWALNSSGGMTTYSDSPADSVVFDDSATGTTTIGLATVLSPNSVVFNNNAKTYTLSGAGGIGGLTGITKTNQGTVFLDTANNTYSGSTAIQSGILAVGTGGSLSPNSLITLGSGTSSGSLQVGDSTGPVNVTVSAIAISGTGTANAVIGGSSSNSTFTVNNGSPAVTTYNGFLGSGTPGSSTANNLTLGKAGSGTLVLTGANTYTGGTVINAGTLNVTNNNALGTGTVSFTANATLQAGADVTLANDMNLGTAATAFDNNGHTLTLTGALTNNGQPDVQVLQPKGLGTNVIAGTFNLSGGVNDTNQQALFMSYTGNTTTVTGSGVLSGISTAWYGSQNTLNLAPTGTGLTLTNSDTALDVGQSGGAAGVINQTAGTVNIGGNLALGKWDGSYGSYTMTGGTLNIQQVVSGGHGNGPGNSYFLQTGGNTNVSNYTILSDGGGGTNTFYLGGGNYTNVANGFLIASSGDSTCVATVAGGTLSVNAGSLAVGLGNTVKTTGTLNLNGGTTIASAIVGVSPLADSIVNLNGGTVQAATYGTYLGHFTTANVYSGGAVFNTSGQSITVDQNLLGAASSMGLNTTVPIANGGSNYIGAPVVNISGGGGTGATAVANVSNGHVTGIIITSPGTGYTPGSAPTIALLGGGGSGATLGSFGVSTNAPDGGVTKLGTGTLTLLGSNTYTGNTQVLGGTLAVGNSAALGSGSAVLSGVSTLALKAIPPSNISFNNTGSGIPFKLSGNTTAETPSISANGKVLTVTTALNSESAAAFSADNFPIDDTNGFVANFTYTHAATAAYNNGNQAPADGITFTVAATNYGVGLPGANLGYGTAGGTSLNNSVAVVLDMFHDNLGFGVNGAFTKLAANDSSPAFSTTSSSNVNIVYNGPTQTLTATVTSNADGSLLGTYSDNVDIASILGTAYGYVGFTGSTGGFNDTQTITNFYFDSTSTNLPGPSATGITNNVNVAAGATSTLQLSATANFSSGSVGPISIGTGGTLAVSIGSSPFAGVTRGVLTTPSINASSGKLDVGKNALDITSPTQSLGSVTAMIKSAYLNGAWSGSGITSFAAAADRTHLTTLGVIQNNQNGTALYTASNPFEGITPGASDILVKYTYYGDANLDGKVDASDYSRIDSGFLSHATGWYNGDFNYDGVIDGSDYTLIDNAFNTQGASLATEFATPAAQATAQIAGGSSVPEPASLGLLTIGAAGLLGRRRRR